MWGFIRSVKERKIRNGSGINKNKEKSRIQMPKKKKGMKEKIASQLGAAVCNITAGLE